MADGKAKADKQRRRASVKRVLAFSEWITADAEYRRQEREWREYGFPMKMKVKPEPPTTGLPSDNDYKIAREEGAIS